jgi:serine/threonine protein kinase
LIIQLLKGLTAVHASGIIHRDIKSDNILVNKDDHLMITDFGISIDSQATPPPYNGAAGSPPYMAPEITEGANIYGTEVDIWSLGVVVYEMVTGQQLLGPTTKTSTVGGSKRAVRALFSDTKCSFARFLRQNVPAEFAELVPVIEKMLCLDPKQRVCAGGALELVQKIKQISVDESPRGRPGMAEHGAKRRRFGSRRSCENHWDELPFVRKCPPPVLVSSSALVC